MYPTSHQHHLSIHENSELKNIKPQQKVLGCFLIVLSIAFSDVRDLFQIFSHIFLVFYILSLTKIPAKTYLKIFQKTSSTLSKKLLQKNQILI